MHLTHFLQSAIPFVLILGLLVFAHEWGHYLSARRAGMKVHAFSIGMGPAIWTFRRRFPAHPETDRRAENGKAVAPEESEETYETTYSICAIPIGGYVRIAGMDPNEDPDEPGGFNTKSWGWRFLTLIAGCVMNFVLAALLFCIMGMLIGYPTGFTNKIGEVLPKTPAAQAQLQPGDQIVSVGNVRTASVDKLRKAIESHPGQAVQISIQRDGQLLVRTVTPAATTEDGKKIGRIGIAFLPVRERVNPAKALYLGVERTYEMTHAMIQGLVMMVTGKVQGRLGGPVAIFQQTGEAAQGGPGDLLAFAAMLSIDLGLMNLLPIPALDGGRLLFLVVEAVRGGRRVDPKKEAYVHFVGLVLILLFMVIVTYHDIKDIIHPG
jgi:regulator of sigma E protease